MKNDLKAKQFLKSFIKNDFETPYKIDNEIIIRRSKFGSELDDIISDIKKRKGRSRRTIFLLDQYGYKKVPVGTINYIFKELPNSEIILTFNVDSMIDYLSDQGVSEKTLDNVGLNYDLTQIRKIKAEKRRWKALIQFALFDDFRDKSSAKHISNLFIKSSNSSRAYWLLHFSMKEIAKNEMEKIHWEYRNHFYSETDKGLRVFSAYDPKKDLKHTGQEEFSFDYNDKIESEEQLIFQIPKYLSYDKITAHKFYLREMDDTPATKEMIYDAIMQLYRLKQIKITTNSGRKKRTDVSLNDDDLICREKQTIINF
ncbi:three-Cys-motif partner protein TcmP [Fodinibius sp. SL11]|uniref:three-Cys-motif partner protein TcmP n=1 Tax=Fodinibius sp. SL11 TaxID=3425690 RepID=UPI003F880E2D